MPDSVSHPKNSVLKTLGGILCVVFSYYLVSYLHRGLLYLVFKALGVEAIKLQWIPVILLANFLVPLLAAYFTWRFFFQAAEKRVEKKSGRPPRLTQPARFPRRIPACCLILGGGVIGFLPALYMCSVFVFSADDFFLQRLGWNLIFLPVTFLFGLIPLILGFFRIPWLMITRILIVLIATGAYLIQLLTYLFILSIWLSLGSFSGY